MTLEIFLTQLKKIYNINLKNKSYNKILHIVKTKIINILYKFFVQSFFLSKNISLISNHFSHLINTKKKNFYTVETIH